MLPWSERTRWSSVKTWKGFVPRGSVSASAEAGGCGCQTVYRVLVDLCQTAELTEGPVIHGECTVAKGHGEDILPDLGRHVAGSDPSIHQLGLLLVAVLPERL